ncbi:MAG: hypothetical protein PHR47_02845 [Candidatus Pacebacteria bacterium]|nr:hypothetical protein [Candidatus Paceibacterota bacterium]
MENSQKTFSLYFILYGIFTILLIVVPLLIFLISILAKIGMTAIISFFVIVSIGTFFLVVWMFLFYLINFIFYISKNYPHRTDNLFINTFSNLIIVVILSNNEYLSLLLIFPTINLLLNFKCFLYLVTIKINKKELAEY